MLCSAWRSVARRSLLALAAGSLALPGLAQQTLGSLNGTVLDPSGAAISGATVTATDSAINVTRVTTTQKNGFFQIFNLPVGTYSLSASNPGFETTTQSGIEVLEAQAKTVDLTLKVGNASQTVQVTANPLLNATDTTNGYTLDAAQIAVTPLATGSFTQLAVLSPGTSAELLANLDSNAGMGNQPIWANGQRDTSNTFQVDGVDVTNIFNGKSSSDANSQRYNFGVGELDPVAGGEYGDGTSVYASNGNSLPSPPPEFTQELRVNTSMYDAQQGATAGAQIDVNTSVGTNQYHGQVYGTFANNALNADPLFFKQEALLSVAGIYSLPLYDANPALHRWTSGATLGGPIKKNKLFFFLAYQYGYNSDQATGLSQVEVPSGLTNDRSAAGLQSAFDSWYGSGAPTLTIDPIASALMNAKLPDGSFMIPSTQNANAPLGVPNVTLNGTSLFTTNQANAAIDYNMTGNDRLSFKYYYQNDPVQRPYGLSQVGGFPLTQNNGAQLGAIDNTITLGPRLNWEQRLGYVRMSSYSYDNQTVIPPSGVGPNFGIGSNPAYTPSLYTPGILPGLDLLEFGANVYGEGSLSLGPYGTESTTINAGYYQNRLNPSSNVIFTLGKHTLMAGGGFSYTQLNIENNRGGIANVEGETFQDFLEGKAYRSNVIDSIQSGRNNSDRYYRSNESDAYVQDKWQMLPNLSITAGVRYDYHGGMTEKYGNFFTFDPSLYSVSGTTATPNQPWTVQNSGFVVAPNNRNLSGVPSSNIAGSDSTLDGRQWGISPRVGFAWSPAKLHGNVVIRGGGGMYYDRGELFSYLSQPYGASGGGGVFGVTQSAPLVTYVTGTGTKLADPIGSPSVGFVPPNANPANINTVLQTTLNTMTGTNPAAASDGPNCDAIHEQDYDYYSDCPATIDFGSYDPHNVLPYTINYTLGIEWQPRNDVAVSIGYVGNRGRHSVIPIPFNEPELATAQNPVWGQTSSYGYQVLNQNSTSQDTTGTYDFNSIAVEPWNTYSGGNVDFRTPYIGYNFNSALFKTVGESAYDALQVHIDKRLSHNFQGGASYTWSHTLDEQSDVGIFFTGDNPDNLRQSWASADFDRTHVFSVNFDATVPNLARAKAFTSYLTNGWHLTGVGIAQSGQPYSLYEFYGAVGSIFLGNYPNLMNPIIGIKDASNPKKALTGNKGIFRDAAGDYIPTIDPSELAINYLTPGQDGIPVSTGSDPQDIYETDFAPGDQRNILRQPFQKRVDLSLHKTFKISERYSLDYAFNVFNVTNTSSLDVPQNQTQIGQADACSNTAAANDYCNTSYLDYGQVVTANNPTDQQSALNNLYKLPVVNGSGRNLTVPLNVNGAINNGATFGSITSVIGGSRAVTMGLHFTY